VRVSLSIAQRFALPALGRAADKARKQDFAESLKTAKKRADPTYRMHAVLGGFMPMLFGASANLPTKYFTVIR
jgi:hypothetical protein